MTHFPEFWVIRGKNFIGTEVKQNATPHLKIWPLATVTTERLIAQRRYWKKFNASDLPGYRTLSARVAEKQIKATVAVL